MQADDARAAVVEFDPGVLDRAPFGRNRLLAGLGASLFGFATSRILRTEPALAQHRPVPYPCEGFRECHYCDGSLCYRYCSWPGGGHTHCRSGGQYWEVCTSNGNRYRCRDWHEDFNGDGSYRHCICSAGLGRC